MTLTLRSKWVGIPILLEVNWNGKSINVVSNALPRKSNFAIAHEAARPFVGDSISSWIRVSQVVTLVCRLAAVISSLSEVGLWIYDLERGTLSPLARSGEVYGPVWTRDGQALTFHWLDKGQRHVAMQPADGSAPPRVVMPGELYPASFTPDGRQLLVVDAARDDILRVTVDTTPASAQP